MESATDAGGERRAGIVRTSVIGIAGNAVLVAFKASIGLLIGSISIVLDAVNNLTDALSSVITIVGTKVAGRRPDRKHPYGYGRVEYLTYLIIAAIVLFAGATAVYESIQGIVDDPLCGNPADYSVGHYAPVIIVTAAIVAKVALGRYFRKMGSRYASPSLTASGTDALMDSLLSVGTLVAAIVALLTGIGIESYLGLVIGLFIVRSGIEILADALNSIVGKRADPEVTNKLLADIESVPGAKGAYDLILNSYGPSRTIASVHVEVDDGLTAKEIDRMSREMVAGAYRRYGIVLTVGIYASNTSGEDAREIKDRALAYASEHPEILQMHGFYLSHEDRVVSLDIVVDFEADDPDRVSEAMWKDLSDAYPEYRFYVNVDTDYSVDREA